MQLSLDLLGAPRPSAAQTRPRVPLFQPLEEPKVVVEQDTRATLRSKLVKLERGAGLTSWGVLPFGDARVDERLPGGGLGLGRLHELEGAAAERETPAAVTGFSACLAARAAREGAILWALQRDDLHAPGLVTFGIAPDRLIFVRADRDDDVLSVVEHALRTRGIGAVIGEVSALDLTQSRRLQLVCERGGATAFVLRRNLFGVSRKRTKEEGSAAATRWAIAAAPSETPSETNEPGLGPTRWAVRLERARGGRSGAWIMEHNDATAQGALRVVAELADHAAEANDGRETGCAPKFREPGLRDHGARRQRASSGGG